MKNKKIFILALELCMCGSIYAQSIESVEECQLESMILESEEESNLVIKHSTEGVS